MISSRTIAPPPPSGRGGGRPWLATPEEKKRLLPLNALPILRSDDPIAQYLGLRPGDVVRVDRLDGTVYWRHLVVAA